MRSIYRFLGCAVFTLAIASGALADDTSGKSNEQLAKEAQNPIADLISIPFQNNFNFGYGPYGKLQYILNIQPVVPFHISDDWNLITRTIVPVISQPEVSPLDKGNWGIGDVNPTFFFSPSHSGEIIWGFGPTLTLPTAPQKNLGSNQWTAGPAFVALTPYRARGSLVPSLTINGPLRVLAAAARPSTL